MVDLSAISVLYAMVGIANIVDCPLSNDTGRE